MDWKTQVAAWMRAAAVIVEPRLRQWNTATYLEEATAPKGNLMYKSGGAPRLKEMRHDSCQRRLHCCKVLSGGVLVFCHHVAAGGKLQRREGSRARRTQLVT